MYVRPQSDVVRQVVAGIVRVVIDHNVIGVPEPIIDINEVRICNLEEEPAKTKAVWIAAAQPPYMPSANGSGEAPVFPRMIKMVTRVVPFVADPAIVFRVNMRCLRMAFGIAVGAVVLLGRLMGSRMWRSVCWRWAVGWNVSIADAMFCAVCWRLGVLRRSVLLIVMFLGEYEGTGKQDHRGQAAKSE